MGVADSIDQLRCNAWLLARRAQRWGRAWQSDAEDLAERARWTSRRRRAGRWLSRTTPVTATVAGYEALKDRFFEPEDWTDRLSRQARQQGRAMKAKAMAYRQRLARHQEEESSLLGKAAKATAAFAGLKALFGREEEVPEADEEGTLFGKAAKGTAAYLGLQTLFGRREEDQETHRLAWWLGFALAAAATATYVATRNAQRSLKPLTLEPGMQRFTTAFGHMAYRTLGQGRPLVLIHAIAPGESHHVWDANIHALAAHFKVFAVDLLGFGASDKPDITYTADRMSRALEDFLRDVVQEPAVLVAAGLSAGFATRTAAQNPDLVTHLLLVNPTGRVGSGRGRKLAGVLNAVPGLQSTGYLAMTRRSRIEDMLSDEVLASPDRVSPDLVNRYYDGSRQPGASHAVRDMMAGRLDVDLPCELGCVQAPVTLIWGRHDRLVPVESAQALIESKPGTDLTVFDNSAMLPQCEEADTFNRLVIDRITGATSGMPTP